MSNVRRQGRSANLFYFYWVRARVFAKQKDRDLSLCPRMTGIQDDHILEQGDQINIAVLFGTERTIRVKRGGSEVVEAIISPKYSDTELQMGTTWRISTLGALIGAGEIVEVLGRWQDPKDAPLSVSQPNKNFCSI